MDLTKIRRIGQIFSTRIDLSYMQVYYFIRIAGFHFMMYRSIFAHQM